MRSKVLVAIGVAVLVLGFVGYRIVTSDNAKKYAAMVAEMKRATEAAGTAPGTDELRELGCTVPAVMDMRGVYKIVGAQDGGTPSLLVLCNLRGNQPPPSCDDVSATYLAAVPDQQLSFQAMVRQQETNKVICEQTHLRETNAAAGTD